MNGAAGVCVRVDVDVVCAQKTKALEGSSKAGAARRRFLRALEHHHHHHPLPSISDVHVHVYRID
jgi:hypothetical protein